MRSFIALGVTSVVKQDKAVEFNEELHTSNLYSSPSIIRMIKSRRMGRAGHVAQMKAKRNAYRLLVGKPERKTN
jgi:hypothetical protein